MPNPREISGAFTQWLLGNVGNGNKAHQLRCLRIQAEQCGMHNPSLALKGSEQTRITHIYLELRRSCSLHFQHSPVCCSCSRAVLLLHPLQPVLACPGCEQYSFSLCAVLRGLLATQLVRTAVIRPLSFSSMPDCCCLRTVFHHSRVQSPLKHFAGLLWLLWTLKA